MPITGRGSGTTASIAVDLADLLGSKLFHHLPSPLLPKIATLCSPRGIPTARRQSRGPAGRCKRGVGVGLRARLRGAPVKKQPPVQNDGCSDNALQLCCQPDVRKRAPQELNGLSEGARPAAARPKGSPPHCRRQAGFARVQLHVADVAPPDGVHNGHPKGLHLNPPNRHPLKKANDNPDGVKAWNSGAVLGQGTSGRDRREPSPQPL